MEIKCECGSILAPTETQELTTKIKIKFVCENCQKKVIVFCDKE